MVYAIEHIARALKEAREAKGFSQRDLSKKTGVPQGHISKIENGSVDLRLSSLIALARVLDLELQLVPRNALSAINAVLRSSGRKSAAPAKETRAAIRELNRIEDLITRIRESGSFTTDLIQIQSQIRGLPPFRLTPPELEHLRAARVALESSLKTPHELATKNVALSHLKSLRNSLVHRTASAPELKAVQPAYSLEDDDD